MPRAFLKAREPFSSYSHFIGAVLSGAGLFVLLVRLLFDPSVTGSLAAAAVVFCLSLIALYSASSVYHFSGRGEAVLRRLKKLDHSMIYVLIAGSYTPIILKFMPAPRSYVFLGVIWLIALTGIAIKLLWIDAPRLIGTALYLALGWAIAFDFGVVLSMPVPAIALLAAGGLSIINNALVCEVSGSEYRNSTSRFIISSPFSRKGFPCDFNQFCHRSSPQIRIVISFRPLWPHSRSFRLRRFQAALSARCQK